MQERQLNSRSRAPVALIAGILVLAIWWAVGAQNQDRSAAPGPAQQAIARVEKASLVREQPVVVRPTKPVDIYLESGATPPVVHVVPKGRKLPVPIERLSRVSLPSGFKYQDETWVPSGEAVTASDAKLLDIGAMVDGSIVYADQDTHPPYKSFYLESSPGSGVFIEYR